MLSIFPSLLILGGFAPPLLRLTLGTIFLFWSYKAFSQKKQGARDSSTTILSILEGLAGILLILGLFTQLAALVCIIILGSRLLKKIQEKAFFTDGVNYYFILFIIAVSILLTGPGFIGLDHPL